MQTSRPSISRVQSVAWIGTARRHSRAPRSLACLFGLLLLASGLMPVASAQICLSYDLVRIAETGQFNLASMDPDVSINDHGDVAFIGRLPEAGTGIMIPNLFVGTGAPGSLHSISPGITSAFETNLGEGLRITNQDRIIVRRRLSIPTPFGPEIETYLESWNVNAINSKITLVSAQPIGTEFDGIYGFPSMNNSGGYVFAALDGGSNYLATSTPAGGFKVNLVSELPHPVMTDDNHFVARLGSDKIVKFPPAFLPFAELAGPGVGGFTTVGREPGATDDGSIVAFIGNRGQGTGLFVNVPFTTGKSTLRVAGENTDNFSAFDGEQRVGVAKGAAPDPETLTVIFAGTRFGQSGVYAIEGKPVLNAMTGQLDFATGSTVPVVRVGDVVDGKFVATVGLHDPINGAGQVAVHVGYDDGTQSVERAERVSSPMVTLRVSAKRILSAGTNQCAPEWGNPHAAGGPDWGPVETAIADASMILQNQIGVALQLVETVDIVNPLVPISWTQVDTSELDQYEGYAESNPCDVAWRTNAMNIYFVFEAVGDSGGAAALAFSPNQMKNDIVFIGTDVENVARAVAHEVGHHVGLLHTHESGPFGAEGAGICLSEGLNCESAGDQVCDTPFDPQSIALLEAGYGCSSCFGCASPEFNSLRFNVMSYYGGINKDNALLTPGQGDRAHKMIELFRQDEVVQAPGTPLVPACPWLYLGQGLAGISGVPVLVGKGTLLTGSPATLMLSNAKPVVTSLLIVGTSAQNAPFKGGVLVPVANLLVPLPTGPTGSISLTFPWPPFPSGAMLLFQVWLPDAAGPAGWAGSNALSVKAP